MHPAYHMRLLARDMTLVGQLILQNGMWEGVQIVPQEWVHESTTAYSNFNRYEGGQHGMCKCRDGSELKRR